MKPIKPFSLKSAAVLMGSRARQVLQFINAFLGGHFQVSVGNRSELIVTDQNVTLVLGKGLFRQSAGDPSSSTSGNAPFEILTPNNGTATWNTIQVNNGVTGLRVQLDGPGQQDAANNFAPGPWGLTGANADITLPAADGTYYVWAVFDPSANGNNGTVTVKVGSSPAGAFPSADGIAWSEFPWEDSYHFIIGIIIADLASQTVTVGSQIKDANVTLTWDQPYFSGIIYNGPYSATPTFPYVVGQSLVIGQAADFGTKGLYIYIAFGAGPGGLWTKLADLT